MTVENFQIMNFRIENSFKVLNDELKMNKSLK